MCFHGLRGLLLACLLLPGSVPGAAAPPPRLCINLIPGFRFSSQVRPELRLFSGEAARCEVRAERNHRTLRTLATVDLEAGREAHVALDLTGIRGALDVTCQFRNAAGATLGTRSHACEVVDSGSRSTRLLDGAWVSLYHWSEDEGRRFNPDLGRLTAREWQGQVHAMARAGIRQIIIQNVFECDEYAGKHAMTAATYHGKAYYPSALYPGRHALGASDPVEAILSAADADGVHVFLGVGLFAWFDFSAESLAWHKAVTAELAARYGRHASLYGWYVSEEIFGSLYHEWEPLKPERYRDLVDFFTAYQAFVRDLTPTKPVALAPNNERFETWAAEWAEILPHVDILIPFGFARDADHMNVPAVAEICRKAGTRFWVDMEMFAWPIQRGLAPKTAPELVKEIRLYDDLEQICGYQFTGIMNAPDSRRNLGGSRAKALYAGYLDYYRRQAHTGDKP